jgi:putative N6-adenine-specific DNA methylase
MEIIATTFEGLEQVLAKEIEALGGQHIRLLNRAVAFDGNKRLLYAANIWLRTAVRILTPIKKTFVKNDKDLYHFFNKDIDWSHFLETWDKFVIDPVIWSKNFPHSQYVAQKAKDGIVDQFRMKKRSRPTVSNARPQLRINLRIMENELTLAFDSSDDPLFKRGYRKEDHLSPVNEVTAAAMLYLSGWDQQSPLVDPMCGSGTLLTEAALMATNRAPGLLRKEFGFQRWRNFDEPLWNEVVASAEAATTETNLRFYGSDLSAVNIIKAQQNVNAAHLNHYISLQKKNVLKLSAPTKQKGWIVSNPPYDERWKVEDINQFYGDLSQHLRQEFAGWKAWFISSNHDALKAMGESRTEIPIKNSSLDCWFREVVL